VANFLAVKELSSASLRNLSNGTAPFGQINTYGGYSMSPGPESHISYTIPEISIEDTAPAGEPEPEAGPDPEPPQPPPVSLEGISIDQIIEWVKRNPWIIQLVTENPDIKKLKEELVKYFENHAGWEKEKQEILNELTDTGNTGKQLQLKLQQIAQLKAQASVIDTGSFDGLNLLLQKKNQIILELESALETSKTISQSNHFFYAGEFELRYIANGILDDVGDNMNKINLFVIGLGGYYDPWKKTYGAGIFVGINLRSILKRIF
jgi:hypothetical protein